jgi:hypothetical protein
MSQSKNKKYSPKAKRQRMKAAPLLIAAGGLLLISLAFFALRGKTDAAKAPIEITGSPSLKVDQEKVELGDVKLGQYVSASFELTNTGDQPLRFLEDPYIEVAAGC